MVATAAWCSRAWPTCRYDMASTSGCAGASTHARSGKLVHVVSDRLAELGAEDDERFLTIRLEAARGRGLSVSRRPDRVRTYDPPADSGARPAAEGGGITVNTVHGHEPSIAGRPCSASSPQVESMEGAAFMYACLITQCAVRRGARRVERRRTAQSQAPGRWRKRIRRLCQTALGDAGAEHEAVPRLFALSERLLHVRRDRPPPHRSRGSRVRWRLADVEALNRAAFAGQAESPS